MKIFVIVCFAGALIGAVTNAMVMGTTNSWPKEVKRGIGYYAAITIEQVAIAAWAAYVLWA